MQVCGFTFRSDRSRKFLPSHTDQNVWHCCGDQGIVWLMDFGAETDVRPMWTNIITFQCLMEIHANPSLFSLHRRKVLVSLN